MQITTTNPRDVISTPAQAMGFETLVSYDSANVALKLLNIVVQQEKSKKRKQPTPLQGIYNVRLISAAGGYGLFVSANKSFTGPQVAEACWQALNRIGYDQRIALHLRLY